VLLRVGPRQSISKHQRVQLRVLQADPVNVIIQDIQTQRLLLRRRGGVVGRHKRHEILEVMGEGPFLEAIVLLPSMPVVEEGLRPVVTPQRKEVRLAEHSCPPAMPAQDACNAPRLVGNDNAIAAHAVGIRELSGQQRGPAGHADGVSDIHPFKDRPLSGKPIQLGSPDIGMAHVPQSVEAMLIGCDQQDIACAFHTREYRH